MESGSMAKRSEESCTFDVRIEAGKFVSKLNGQTNGLLELQTSYVLGPLLTVAIVIKERRGIRNMRVMGKISHPQQPV